MEKDQQCIRQILTQVTHPHTLLLDMRKTARHWLLGYEYFIIRPEHQIKDLAGKTCFTPDSYQGFRPDDFFYAKVNTDVSESVHMYWSESVDVGRISICAWSAYTVEKDTCLLYLFDKDDNYKGVYCHCLNRVEEIIYVGNSLADFFDFESTIHALPAGIELHEDIPLIRKKMSKAKSQMYTQLLRKKEYLILDAEFGFVPTFSLYKNFIDATIIPLTSHELKYDRLEPVSEEGRLSFNWVYQEVVFTFNLNNESDYIDAEVFYETVNAILALLQTKKKLVVFREHNFGQEYGLAYISDSTRQKLQALFNIEIMNG